MSGLIHVGAHDASEYDPLIRPRPLMLIEPMREPYLRAADLFPDDIYLANVACGSESGFAEMNVCPSHPTSSSLLPPERHLDVFPEMRFEGTEAVKIETLDHLTSAAGPVGAPPVFSDLIVDVQGYELEVLAGAEATLRNVSRVRCEVSTVEMFKGQPLLPEVDLFLAHHGFVRTITDLRFRGVHGDAYYVRR